MKKFIFILLLFASCTHAQEKHVIGGRNAGFFSNFMGVLNHLTWCKAYNKNPVVYWDHNCPCYYEATGYNNATNVWEYYFEPVSSATYEKEDAINTTYQAPDNTSIKAGPKDFTNNFELEFRVAMHDIIDHYVKIKPSIMRKIQEFYFTHMAGKKTIGMHIRGTDKFTEAPPIALKAFIKAANKFKNCQILVATDENCILERLKKKLKHPVISYDAHRSFNNMPIHINYPEKVSKALLGEEILIEAKLLSLCDVFIHGNSNVALGVLFFNPWLKNIYLDENSHKKTFWYYLKKFFNR